MGVARLAAKQYVFLLVQQALAIAAVIATTHLLRPEGRGMLSAVYIVPNAVLIIGDLGLGLAANRWLGNKEANPREIGATLLWGGATLGMIWALLIWALYTFFPGVLRIEVSTYQKVIVLIQMPFTLANMMMSHLSVYRRMLGFEFLANAAAKLLNVASLVVIALVLVPGDAPEAILDRLLAVILALSVGVTAANVLRHRDWTLGKPSARLFRAMLRFGWGLSFANAFMYLIHYGDQYYIDRLDIDPVVTLGIYTLAYSLLEIVSTIGRSINAMFARVMFEESHAESDRLAIMVARRSSIIIVGAGAMMALAAPLAVAVLAPPEFAPAVAPLRVLLLSAPFHAAGVVLSSAATVRGRIFLTTLPTFVAFAGNIGLNILWIPDYGMLGAAWATVLSFAALFSLRWMIYGSIAGWRPALGLFRFERADFRFLFDKARRGFEVLFARDKTRRKERNG